MTLNTCASTCAAGSTALGTTTKSVRAPATGASACVVEVPFGPIRDTLRGALVEVRLARRALAGVVAMTLAILGTFLTPGIVHWGWIAAAESIAPKPIA